MNPKLDQSDINAQISTMEAACGILIGELRQAGQSPPQSPVLISGDALGNLDRLHDYHARLAGTLAKRFPYVPASTANTRSAETTAAPVAAPAAVSPASPAELTVAELTALTLGERCQIAGKFLTVEQARANISARAEKKERTTVSFTERVLAAKGVKTLAEATAKRLASPLQAGD